MLEPWIIEEIRRREREESIPLQLELPLDEPLRHDESETNPEVNRGVVIIDLDG